ncbi:MAG: cell division protein FtsL [Lachnospiraceae bacterium]|nr:cell division protein FtsL [Lachnospiraceae bacterium]
MAQTARNQYNYGNTAEKYHEYRVRMEQPLERVDPVVHKNQQRAKFMDLPYVLFLCVAFIAVAFSAIMMIRAQENLKESVHNASKLENQYVTLKADNDATYDRIVNSVDPVEVKRIATEELGMHYAAEGQIITYAGELDDYVRQYQDIR